MGQAENERKKKSFLSVPTQSGVGNSKKIAKKIQKIKKLQYSFFKSENGMGLAENQKKKKIIVLIHSNLTRNREFQKNSKKIEKITKINMASSQAKTGWERLRMREKRKFSS